MSPLLLYAGLGLMMETSLWSSGRRNLNKIVSARLPSWRDCAFQKTEKRQEG
jgi:hypothetical protein